MKKNSQDTIRTFIAVELPQEIQDELQRLQNSLRASMPDVRWTKYGNIHLTLKFLGDVRLSKVEAIGEAIRSVASQLSPFVMSLAGVGAFPNPRKPRIVWVGVEAGADELVEMARLVEASMRKLGFPREKPPFRPHLTVGRIRHLENPEAMTEALERSEIGELGRFTVEKLSFIKSQLDPGGSIYTTLTEAFLAGSGIG